jgi:hypothetical protein
MLDVKKLSLAATMAQVNDTVATVINRLEKDMPKLDKPAVPEEKDKK